MIREEGTHSAEERAACEEHSTPFEPFVNMSDEWSQNVSGELEEYSGFIHLPCSSMCCFGDSDDPLIFNEGRTYKDSVFKNNIHIKGSHCKFKRNGRRWPRLGRIALFTPHLLESL